MFHISINYIKSTGQGTLYISEGRSIRYIKRTVPLICKTCLIVNFFLFSEIEIVEMMYIGYLLLPL